MSRSTIDLGYPTEVHGRIPSFNNVEEEAAFRNTHDVTDYLDESKPAEISVGGELAERHRLRLERADRVVLVQRAE